MSWNNKEEIETTCSTVQQWRYSYISAYVNHQILGPVSIGV